MTKIVFYFCLFPGLESIPTMRCPFWCRWRSAAGEPVTLSDPGTRRAARVHDEADWRLPALPAGWGSQPTYGCSCWRRKSTNCPRSWPNPWRGTASRPSSSSLTWTPWTDGCAWSVILTLPSGVFFFCVKSVEVYEIHQRRSARSLIRTTAKKKKAKQAVFLRCHRIIKFSTNWQFLLRKARNLASFNKNKGTYTRLLRKQSHLRDWIVQKKTFFFLL